MSGDGSSSPGRPVLYVSFSAGGWFQMYHFGVAEALKDTGVMDAYDVCCCGCSAGSLAAATLTTGCCFPAMRDFALECAEHSRTSLWNVFRMRDYVLASLHRFGERQFEPDRAEATLRHLNSKLEVYATVLPYLRVKVFRKYNTLDDVEEALLASCCLTPLVSFPFRLRETKEWVCDGGLVAFQPRQGEPSTITVSPFYFTMADIKPSRYVPAWWALFPPARAQHRNLYTMGYCDAVNYLVRSHLVPLECVKLLQPEDTELLPRRRMPWVRDMVFVCLFFFLLRPLAFVLIYSELAFVAWKYLLLSVVRPAALVDWYHSVRNVLSVRVFLRLLIFWHHIPINESRLRKYSCMYRILQPLLYDS